MSVLLVAVAVGGCGGKSFTAKADDVCKKYSAKLKALPQPKTNSEIADYLKRAAPLARDGTKKLKALKPPKDKKDAYRDYLSGLDREVTLIEQAATAADAGDLSGATTLLDEQSSLSKDDDKKAKSLGLKECGKA